MYALKCQTRLKRREEDEKDEADEEEGEIAEDEGKEDNLQEAEEDDKDSEDEMQPIFYKGFGKEELGNDQALKLHIQSWCSPLRPNAITWAGESRS